MSHQKFGVSNPLIVQVNLFYSKRKIVPYAIQMSIKARGVIGIFISENSFSGGGK